MNCIIPFKSKVSFEGPVKEICSVSLEHDVTKNETDILGNFYISGTYKEHELSVNTNDYQFTVPFSLELTNRIDPESLKFEIENFTYVLEGNDMLIDIDYSLTAEDYFEEIEDKQEELFREETPVIENTLKAENLLSSINEEEDYTVYKIHHVSNDETIEIIAEKYHTTKDDILKTNNIKEINVNDTLIIRCNE